MSVGTDPQGPSILAEFAVVPKAGSTNRGLARRLMDGTLRPPEREDLARVEEIARLEEEGKQYREIAELLGWERDKLAAWVKTDKYRLLRRYVAERATLTDDASLTQRRAQERRKWDGYASKALDYFTQAFKQHPRDDEKKGIKAGAYVDLDRAERASRLIAGAQGWLDPLPQAAKPRTLTPGVIQAQMQAIRATDRRELVVRVETQTVEIRALAPSLNEELI